MEEEEEMVREGNSLSSSRAHEAERRSPQQGTPPGWQEARKARITPSHGQRAPSPVTKDGVSCQWSPQPAGSGSPYDPACFVCSTSPAKLPEDGSAEKPESPLLASIRRKIGALEASISARVRCQNGAMTCKEEESPVRRLELPEMDDCQRESQHQRTLEHLQRKLAEVENWARGALTESHAQVCSLEDRMGQLEQHVVDQVHTLPRDAVSPRRHPAAYDVEADGKLSGDTSLISDRMLAEVRALLDQRLEDVSDSISRALEDGRDVRTQVAAQDERLRMLRTLVDAQEERVRMLRGLVDDLGSSGGEVAARGSRAEALRCQAQGERQEQLDRLNLLERRVAEQEQVQEELHDLRRQMLMRSAGPTECSTPRSVAFLPTPREAYQAFAAPRPLPFSPRTPLHGASH